MSFWPVKVNFDDVWSDLKLVCENIMTGTHIGLQRWQNSINCVYHLCVAYPEPYGEEIYEKLVTLLDDHSKRFCEEIQPSKDLLKDYLDAYNTYRKAVKTLNSLFMYFNTRFIAHQIDKQNRSVETLDGVYLEVEQLAISFWKKNVTERFNERMVEVISFGIESDRCGHFTPDYALFHDVINSVIEIESGYGLKFYQVFEDQFLKDTHDYFKKMLYGLIGTVTCVEFIEKVLKWNEEEILRCKKYLDASSCFRVTQEFQKTIIKENLNYLYMEGKKMFQEENKKGLQLMYKLLKPVFFALDPLEEELQTHIINKGKEFINSLADELNPQEFVESTYKFLVNNANFVEEAFDADEQFIKASDGAFTKIINSKENSKLAGRQTELLTKYCDTLLRSQSKTTSYVNIEEKLSHTVLIFKYTYDKDLFLKLYSQMLGKRLLFCPSISLETEGFMITKLKESCGFDDDVRSLSQMLNDAQLNIGLNEKLTNYIEENQIDLGFHLNVSVLRNGAWPVNSVSPRFAVPLVFEKSIQMFETFYSSKFNGRKLTWLHNISYADVKLCYVKKPCTVTMNSYQTAILLLFEKVDSRTFSEIKENTQLGDEYLRKNIEALTFCTLLLTTKESHDIIEPDTLFKLNLKHKSKKRKYKVTFAPSKVKEETYVELQKEHAQVEAGRKIQIEAAIVRIMKSFKRARHTDLVQKVISEVKNKFVPEIPLIKKCIELLIEKEYLKQTSYSNDEYSYIA